MVTWKYQTGVEIFMVILLISMTNNSSCDLKGCLCQIINDYMSKLLLSYYRQYGLCEKSYMANAKFIHVNKFSFMNFVSNYKTWKYLFSYSAMNIKSVIYCKETMKCRKIKDQSWRNWNDIIDKGILLIWTLIVSSKRNAKCLRCWMYLITTQKMHASKLYKSAQENLIF